MVMKEVKRIDPDYLCRLAKRVITPSLGVRFSHTRNSSEIHVALNFKNAIEKDLTKDQQFAYGQMFKRQRDKAERYVKNQKKELIVVGAI